MNYQYYLHSEGWKKISEEAKRLSGNKCQVCNSEKDLHTHHRTYERLGKELQSDLVVLCNECHKLFHNRKKLLIIKNYLYRCQRFAFMFHATIISYDSEETFREGAYKRIKRIVTMFEKWREENSISIKYLLADDFPELFEKEKLN